MATSTVPLETIAPVKTASPAPSSTRLVSIDVYRGFVMFLMMAEALHFWHVSRALPESGFWKFLAFHQSHVDWIGCSLHDMIQPSFSFLVGVALPFSFARRSAKQGRVQMSLHAFWRALLLILLGVFLRSTGHSQTNWTFEDTLTQIGLGYGFLFLLAWRRMRDQWIAFAVLAVGYWAAFALYPIAPEFDYSKVGVPKDWPHLMTGFSAHWNKNSNLAWAFDTWFLNLFPREKPFLFNGGGYATLSFIPTLATMILGLIAGGVIRGDREPKTKVKWLAIAGVISLILGIITGWLGICPVVKRIWTPSWVFFSGGMCFLFMAGFYASVEIMNWRRWTFPLVVIGVNSIAAYCVDHLFDDFIYKNLVTHLGPNLFNFFGKPYEPLFHGAALLAMMWLILFWMYKRKIFLKI